MHLSCHPHFDSVTVRHPFIPVSTPFCSAPFSYLRSCHCQLLCIVLFILCYSWMMLFIMLCDVLVIVLSNLLLRCFCEIIIDAVLKSALESCMWDDALDIWGVFETMPDSCILTCYSLCYSLQDSWCWSHVFHPAMHSAIELSFCIHAMNIRSSHAPVH